jgi:hypothetical protein
MTVVSGYGGPSFPLSLLQPPQCSPLLRVPRSSALSQSTSACILLYRSIIFAHYLDKHSPYFQAGFGLMVSKTSVKRAYVWDIQPQQTGCGRGHNRPPSRRGPRLGCAPPTSPRDTRNQQQGPRLRLVPRVARAPPTYDASSSLGTLASA